MRHQTHGSFILLVVAIMLLAPPASAHTSLQWSRPADGDVVEAPLTEIRLRFSDPVVVQYTSAALIGPDGNPISTPPLEVDAASNRREFYLPVPDRLPGGSYTVRWRTVAADGHTIEGTFSFTLEAEEEPVAEEPAAAHPDEAPDAPVHHPEAAAGVPALAPEAPLSVAIRFLHYLSLLLMLGAVVFHFGVTSRMQKEARVAGLTEAARLRNWRVAAGAFGVFLVVVVTRLWAQSVRLHGPGEAWAWENLTTMLSVTTWGHGWIIQAAGAVAFASGIVLARANGTQVAGWSMAAVAALALALVPGLSGHAARVEWNTALAVLTHVLHVLGAGIWLGTLGILLLVGLPSAVASGQGERMEAVAATVRVFSPVALFGAVLAGLTGIGNALFHFTELSQLWNTEYGTALLIKLGVLAVALALGFYHWRFLLPVLNKETAPTRFRRTAAVELAAGVLVLLVTAVLVALPTPR